MKIWSLNYFYCDNLPSITLLHHCTVVSSTAWKESVFGVILSVISRIWTECKEIFRISPYSVRMGENKDQKKSEYGHFLRSAEFFTRNQFWRDNFQFEYNITQTSLIPGQIYEAFIKGVFRTQSNIEDGRFCKNSYWQTVVDCICKKLHLRSSTGFCIRLCSYIFLPFKKSRNFSERYLF